LAIDLLGLNTILIGVDLGMLVQELKDVDSRFLALDVLGTIAGNAYKEK